MKTAVDNRIGPPPPDQGTARERAQERDPGDGLFAAAFAQTLVAHLPRLPSLPQKEAQPPPVTRQLAPEPAPAWQEGAPGRATPHAGGGRAESSSGLPAELRTEVSDERFGRLELLVARGERGLDIVINVADAHVKALIVADQARLIEGLQQAGLRVGSVQVGSVPRVGIPLAHDRADRARSNASPFTSGARGRGYREALEEEDNAESDGVHFEA